MRNQEKTTGKANTIIESAYQNKTFNRVVTDAFSLTQEFKRYVEQVSTIMDELPRQFGQTLNYHMEKLGMSSSKLAKLSLVNEDVIRRYKNGTTTSTPNIHTVLALCVGLQLPPPLCYDMVKKAKYDFASGGAKDVAYYTIICSMTQNSIYECNEMLTNLGYRPLSKIV